VTLITVRDKTDALYLTYNTRAFIHFCPFDILSVETFYLHEGGNEITFGLSVLSFSGINHTCTAED